MANTFFDVLDWIIHGRSIPTPHPFKPKKTSKPKEKQVEPDLIYSNGRAFVRDERPDGFDDQLWTSTKTPQSATITDDDIQAVTDRGLDIHKAKILKPYWAAGMSAKATADTYNGERGWGKRTIEKYWAAFNQTPTPPK